MKNPFKKSHNNKTPEGEPLEYTGSGSFLGSKKLLIVAAIATFIIIIIVISESVVIVQAGHRGVVLYVGAVENRVLGEGVHFVIPFAEQVIPLEVRTLKYQAEASAASNDLQQVQTVIALNYHLNPADVNKVYQQLGPDYADRVIAPTIQESVKASVAKYDAEELITKRAIVKDVIANTIRNSLSAKDIVVETIFITDFKFSDAFSNQVEDKVVAYQKYLTELNNLRGIQVVSYHIPLEDKEQSHSSNYHNPNHLDHPYLVHNNKTSLNELDYMKHYYICCHMTHL